MVRKLFRLCLSRTPQGQVFWRERSSLPPFSDEQNRNTTAEKFHLSVGST